MTRLGLIVSLLPISIFADAVSAQITGQEVAARKRPHRIGAMLPPGVVAREQLMRSPDSIGYVQPVEIKVPDEATVAVADGGGFSMPHLGRLKIGLQVGNVYRLKVTGIPNNVGGEVYPTVELVGRLRPPEGLQNRFPIPVQITLRDLEHALAGRMVVRAIFLEDPAKAYPEMEEKDNQRTIMALEDEDPLRLAGELGRPMAILRLGSRVPDASGLDSTFLFGSPPVSYLVSSLGSGAGVAIPGQPSSIDGPSFESSPSTSIESTPELVPDVGPDDPSASNSDSPDDQPIIDKRETTPELDDPFVDDPLFERDELPQP